MSRPFRRPDLGPARLLITLQASILVVVGGVLILVVAGGVEARLAGSAFVLIGVLLVRRALRQRGKE